MIAVEASDCTTVGGPIHPDVQSAIRDNFLPRFFAEFAEIVQGRKPDWALPPDAVFIETLESHLDWPVVGTRDFLAEECSRDKAFAAKLATLLDRDKRVPLPPMP